VPAAVRMMKEHGMRNLPVVDGEGKFLGVFTTVHLIELLLPRAATMEGGLNDLTFVHDTLDDVRQRWNEVQDHRVGDFIETEDIPVATAETSLIEVLLLIFQNRTHITIVNEDSKKVVGVVTFSKVIDSLLGDA
jgi:CBS domain-containing protein